MRGASVTCFGTGDGFPCADRNHASFLYRIGRTCILIDCGEALDRNYKASGLSYHLIDAVFISHLHSDHFGGFFMLMQGMWLERRTKPLTVYLPAGAIKPLRAMLNAAFLFNEMFSFRLDLRPLHPGRTLSVGTLRITPYLTSHLEHIQARFSRKYAVDFSAFCFLVEAGRRRLVHSADLGRPEDLEAVVQQPLELLVCELAHFTPRNIFQYLHGRPIQRVAFVHVNRRLRNNIAATRRLAAKLLPNIPHSFPADLEQIAF